jgi:hypothetical protein
LSQPGIILPIDSRPEAQIVSLISPEEKLFLDLVAEIIADDIMKPEQT